MAEEHLNTDLGTIYYLWEGEGRENEGIDILATACKKAVTDVSFCDVVAGGGGRGVLKFQTDCLLQNINNFSVTIDIRAE